MARNGRTTSRPGSRTRARSGPSRTSTRPGARRTTTTGAASTRAKGARRRPRSLRRMTIFGALVVFLAVLITPTLHAYLQRKSQIADLHGKVAAQQKDVADKQAQLKKWKDPDYVRAQAEKRLGFAKPGKTATVIVDKQGVAHEVKTTGNGVSVTLPWYGKVWQSTLNADKHPALH